MGPRRGSRPSAVDAGEILVQREVPVHPWDTAETLHRRLEEASVRLLQDEWPAMLDEWPGSSQPPGGSIRRIADLASLGTFSLDGVPEPRMSYDLLRARSFPPHFGLRVMVDGEAVEARFRLTKIAEVG